ncbi:MAG: S1/P1 nuclease [Terriglobia bacterium]
MKLNYSSRAMRRDLGVVGAACIFLFSPARAWPWGCEGHQAVAMIAEKHMTARALEMANKLLQSQPIDPALPRYCPSQGLDLMADSATWADDLRKVRPEASAWHYIDIPRDAPRSAMAESCPASTGCVTSALQHQIELLRRGDAEPRERADALRFIIHFVGDLHQPLHCVSNNDMGGNCVPVEFFGNPPVEKNPDYETYAPNLHAIWDSGIIQKLKGTESVQQWAAALDAQFGARMSGWEKQGINVEDWAWESHELADAAVYAKLPVAIPVEQPQPVKGCSDDNHVSTRMLKLHEQVSQPYVDAVAPTVNEQIAKAGIRLAMVLNQIWP